MYTVYTYPYFSCVLEFFFDHPLSVIQLPHSLVIIVGLKRRAGLLVGSTECVIFAGPHTHHSYNMLIRLKSEHLSSCTQHHYLRPHSFYVDLKLFSRLLHRELLCEIFHVWLIGCRCNIRIHLWSGGGGGEG